MIKPPKTKLISVFLALVFTAANTGCSAFVPHSLNASEVTPAPEIPPAATESLESPETTTPSPYAVITRPVVETVQTTPIPTPEPTPALTPAPPMPDIDYSTLAMLEPPETIPDDERYIHILLAGVDRRGSKGNSRADTIMIGTLDLEHGCIKLSSILRDTLVYVPDPVDGHRKINAASSKGGMQLLMETINYNFGMNIDSYVVVDFEMFQQLIDSMGGVELELTAKEISAANDCIAGLNKQTGYELRDGFITSAPGLIRLTGKQALGFARIRKTDSDFKRTERQFELLETVFMQFLELPLTTQYSVLYGALPYVSTNISASRIVGLALKALEADIRDMQHFKIPAAGTYKSGTYSGSYALLADIEKNTAALHEFITSVPE